MVQGGLRITRQAARLCLLLVLPQAVASCGHSEDEWRHAQADITHLKADLEAAQARLAADQESYAIAQQQIADFKSSLRELTVWSKTEGELREQLAACQERSCPSSCQPPVNSAESTPAPSFGTARTTDNPGLVRTIPYEGNGGGPTLCADGEASGSSGRGTCSHHGGVAGHGHRKHWPGAWRASGLCRGSAPREELLEEVDTVAASWRPI